MVSSLQVGRDVALAVAQIDALQTVIDATITALKTQMTLDYVSMVEIGAIKMPGNVKIDAASLLTPMLNAMNAEMANLQAQLASLQ